jgi:ComF family protein
VGSLRALGMLLLDAFAPARCSGCDDVSREPICGACMQSLGGLRVPPPARRDGVMAVAAFDYDEPVRRIIHRAKFRGGRAGLERLAGVAAERIGERARLHGDGLVAVPLGRRRLRQRGYNQAEVIASAVGSRLGLAVLPGLVRVRETRPQAEHDGEARRRNVAEAFAWRGGSVRGARLWLVDDVLTTGATAAAAIAPLSAAGARVDVLALAAVA